MSITRLVCFLVVVDDDWTFLSLILKVDDVWRQLGDSSSEEMETSEYTEPKELTTIFVCPMCFKKYASLPDVETHISVFHRIPLKVQRQSLQGGKSMAIITQSL